jgi:hypothetical protein
MCRYCTEQTTCAAVVKLTKVNITCSNFLGIISRFKDWFSCHIPLTLRTCHSARHEIKQCGQKDGQADRETVGRIDLQSTVTLTVHVHNGLKHFSPSTSPIFTVWHAIMQVCAFHAHYLNVLSLLRSYRNTWVCNHEHLMRQISATACI